MAEVLWHELVTHKDSADARDSNGNTFEYLASIKRVNVKTNKGCSFQMDRMARNNLRGLFGPFGLGKNLEGRDPCCAC